MKIFPIGKCNCYKRLPLSFFNYYFREHDLKRITQKLKEIYPQRKGADSKDDVG